MSPKLPRVQGLRRRWLAGSIGPVAAILLLVGALISVGFASNYYNSARSTLRAKAAAGADYFNTYVMIGYKEYYRSATLYAATFDDRPRGGPHPRPDGGHLSQHTGGGPRRGERHGAGLRGPR